MAFTEEEGKEAEAGFFRSSGLAPDVLHEAQALAERWGVALHEVLLSLGHLDARAYARQAAQALGVDHVDENAPRLLGFVPAKEADNRPQCLPVILKHPADSRGETVLDAAGFSWPELVRRCEALRAKGCRIALTSARGLRRVVLARQEAALLRQAICGLEQWRPDLSARKRVTPAQLVVLGAIGTGLGLAAFHFPWASFYGLSFVLSAAFFCVILLRAWALFHFLRGRRRGKSFQAAPASCQASWPFADSALPVYTVLVPLLREAHILPNLMAALGRLDYPPAKLDIKLVLEASDPDTIAAVRAFNLPGHVDVIIVPDAAPHTKPKALNYALNFARGAYVVVYDAEDRPAPDQLKCALAAFRAGGERLACVQARLNIYNPHESWFTRQFTIEYTSLFDAVLPALAACNLPIPLGGTSNHFRIDLLRRVGGWDGHNVTEDADLGVRLARFGLQCGVIAPTTFEEACGSFSAWLGQRTRWLKGWMQTFLVHMRHPWRLGRELGPKGTGAFLVLMGAQILSALAHPVFMGLLAIELWAGVAFLRPESLFGALFWGLALFNLGFGYLVSLLLGAVTLRARGLGGLAGALLFMPVYWFLVSLAAWRAIGQFLTRPHYWEKTEHGLSPVSTAQPGAAQQGEDGC